MQARVISAIAVILSCAACSAFDAPAPSAPELVPAPGFGPASPWAGSTPVNSIGSGQLALSGELQGELRGIALDGETSENFGNYDLYEGGGGSLYMSVAARGAPQGAGMLIVSILDNELEAKLDAGRWTSHDPLGELVPSVSVGSCAGPALGEWPMESGATEYEVEASEDPERPGTVVVLVTAQFPRDDIDFADTAELVGTLRFDRPEWGATPAAGAQ